MDSRKVLLTDADAEFFVFDTFDDGYWFGLLTDENGEVTGGICTLHCEVCCMFVELPTNLEELEYIPPTCEVEGYGQYLLTLTYAGQTYSETAEWTFDALEHNWDSGVVTTEATATHAGVLTYTCSRCGETREEDIPQILLNGYYLIRPNWNEDAIDPLERFTENQSNPGEFMLATALEAGDQRKVVHVTNSVIDGWYPGGTDNNYVVSATDPDPGLVTVYFRPDYTGGDDWHYKCICVVTGRDPYVAHSITLDGEIGENFIVNLTGVDAQDLAAATVTFTWDVTLPDGKVTHNEQTVALNTLEPMTETGYEGCYKLPVKVSAKEMADTITATLTVGGQTYTNRYAVKGYAETILADINHQTYSSELWNLAKAMLNYGAAAQRQFNYRTDALANAQLDAANNTPASLDADEIDELHQNQVGTLPTGITFAGTSLLLKAETTYRLYFTVESGKTLTVTRNGEPLSATKKGSYYYVEIADIAAKEVLDDVVLTVNGVECTFNASDYIRSVLSDQSSDSTLVNTVTALYRYCKAAEAYFTAANTQP